MQGPPIECVKIALRYSIQIRRGEALPRDHSAQDQTRHGYGGKERAEHTDDEDEGEALNRGRAEVEEDERSDQA
ncbi:MAG: hypothetical protein ACK55I_05190, partial [bacterium]